jgi:hypothetical protein
MTTETNVTIDEIMGQIGLHGDDCMRRDADAASVSFEALRVTIAAALDSQARQIEALTAERDRWEAAYREWRPASEFAQGLSNDGALPARDLGRHCGDVLIDHVKRLTAERDELRKRLDDAKPATPAPGEWVEWKGGECPIASGVAHHVKLRSGDEFGPSVQSKSWDWLNHGADGDIVAYRILL